MDQYSSDDGFLWLCLRFTLIHIDIKSCWCLLDGVVGDSHNYFERKEICFCTEAVREKHKVLLKQLSHPLLEGCIKFHSVIMR